MAQNVVYFDLETQRTANDVGGWDRKDKMGMSLGVIYSTALGEYRIFKEDRVDDLISHLREADLVVGYNLLRFDYEVLMAYTVLDLPSVLHTLDMLVEIEAVTGHRVKLESVAQATLGVGKTAEGTDAIRWWREGQLLKIAEYCCFDVKVTKMVHEYAVRHGTLHYLDRSNRRETIAVQWTQPAAA